MVVFNGILWTPIGKPEENGGLMGFCGILWDNCKNHRKMVVFNGICPLVICYKAVVQIMFSAEKDVAPHGPTDFCFRRILQHA